MSEDSDRSDSTQRIPKLRRSITTTLVSLIKISKTFAVKKYNPRLEGK